MWRCAAASALRLTAGPNAASLLDRFRCKHRSELLQLVFQRAQLLPGCRPVAELWGSLETETDPAVISAKLNRYFWNKNPPAEEVKRLNNAPAYTP